MHTENDSTDPKRIVEDGYDRVAHQYAHLEGENEWPRMRWLNRLLDRLQPGSSVLDLGCGSGDPAGKAISKHHNLTGVDISEAQINLARQNVPAGNFIHGDAASVDFPAASFDAVISFYTLEHIPRREHAALMDRIFAWLDSGGYLLLSVEAGEADDITGQWLGVPMFFSTFDPETIKNMIEASGFKILDAAIENQVEQDTVIPYLWVLAHKP